MTGEPMTGEPMTGPLTTGAGHGPSIPGPGIPGPSIPGPGISGPGSAGPGAVSQSRSQAQAGPLGVLARLRQPVQAADPGERCEMCTEAIGPEHAHVVDIRERTLVCTCRACYLLFYAPGAAGGRYRAVPEGYATVVDFELSPAQWDSLQIPVAVAFFFKNSHLDTTAAFFPSPAGATECLLPLETWAEVEAANPIVGSLEPDVQAALIRTYRDDDGHGVECFIVPIDSCYELVGELRRLWRGFDGGREVHQAMASYFARLRDQGKPVGRQDTIYQGL